MAVCKVFSSLLLDVGTVGLFHFVPTPSVLFDKADVCRRHSLFPTVHISYDDSFALRLRFSLPFSFS